MLEKRNRKWEKRERLLMEASYLSEIDHICKIDPWFTSMVYAAEDKIPN
jgi:hypothetical protein